MLLLFLLCSNLELLFRIVRAKLFDFSFSSRHGEGEDGRVFGKVLVNSSGGEECSFSRGAMVEIASSLFERGRDVELADMSTVIDLCRAEKGSI